MADLNFAVEKAEVVRFAATPMLAFRLRVTNADPGEAIYTVALRCQIQIEATRRRYLSADREHLRDLFGEPERWSQTLRPILWTHASAVVPQSREASPLYCRSLARSTSTSRLPSWHRGKSNARALPCSEHC